MSPITAPPTFSHAILRTPGRSMVHGITTAGLGSPDYELALAQHAAYRQALERCGLQTTVLPPLEDFPDSTFVEDVALCTRRGALLTNPGAPSRNGEPAHMREALSAHFPVLPQIQAPGTLDAGDVMMVGDHFYIGLSARTNAAGAAQLIAILRAWGLDGEALPLSDVLHLKTAVNYLEQGNLLTFGELANSPQFAAFHRHPVPPDEAYAANSLWVNGTVIVPDHHPTVLQHIQALGYPTIVLDMSEFQKLDGGLSCLSLRF